MPTLVNGQLVTVTTNEAEYDLTEPFDQPLQLVRLELVSGTLQTGVKEKATFFVPSLNTEATYSTAGDKWAHTIESGNVNLRMKASGGNATVKVTW